MFLASGERGIRTPGPVTVNSFQDYRNRPLCHLSAAKVQLFCKLQILKNDFIINNGYVLEYCVINKILYLSLIDR